VVPVTDDTTAGDPVAPVGAPAAGRVVVNAMPVKTTKDITIQDAGVQDIGRLHRIIQP
jgi:hypothetical protein